MKVMLTLLRRFLAILAVPFALGTLPSMARAAILPVAVAANFAEPAKRLAAAFQLQTGDALALSFGASGGFVTQISQGAPYEIFLSADAVRPEKLVAQGLGVPGTRFAYATGKLALWSAQPGFVDAQGAVLRAGKFNHIAIANPKAAPYGAAAMQTLQALGLSSALAPKIVMGESIAQTYQFVASANAELGFVAYSQIIEGKGGSSWLVPQTMYTPIVQDAVLLKPGANDPAAKAFLAYLQSPAARAVIRSYGYSTAP